MIRIPHQPQMKTGTERGAFRSLGTCRFTLAADNSEVRTSQPLCGAHTNLPCHTGRGFGSGTFSHSPHRTRGFLPRRVWSPGARSPSPRIRLEFKVGTPDRSALHRCSRFRPCPFFDPGHHVRQDNTDVPESHRPFSVAVVATSATCTSRRTSNWVIQTRRSATK